MIPFPRGAAAILVLLVSALGSTAVRWLLHGGTNLDFDRFGATSARTQGTGAGAVPGRATSRLRPGHGGNDDDLLLLSGLEDPAGGEEEEGGEGDDEPGPSSPLALALAKVRRPSMSYRLVQGRPFQHRYSHYSCLPHPGVVEPLPDPLQREGVLDFFPHIATSLRIAVVGDSVGIQIAQVLEEAVGSLKERRIVFEDNAHSNLVVSAPVRGGGAFLSARVNGMLWRELQNDREAPPTRTRTRTRTRRTRNRLLRELVGGDVGSSRGREQRRHRRHLQLRPQPWNRTKIRAALRVPIRSLEAVDVLVQRITFPWTPLNQITIESLERNTRVAADLFGMRTLVYVNFYFCNNVADPEMHNLFREKIQLVRNFTRSYVPSPNSTLKNVLLLNMDALVDVLNEANARQLGYDVENEPFENWMMSHYRGPPAANGTIIHHHHYHAQLCGAVAPDLALSCPRNLIFVDGMHFCPSTLGGRVASGVACLIECGGATTTPRPRPSPTTHSQDDDDALRECERHCNDKFMSLAPVPMSEMVPYDQSLHG